MTFLLSRAAAVAEGTPLMATPALGEMWIALTPPRSITLFVAPTYAARYLQKQPNEHRTHTQCMLYKLSVALDLRTCRGSSLCRGQRPLMSLADSLVAEGFAVCVQLCALLYEALSRVVCLLWRPVCF